MYDIAKDVFMEYLEQQDNIEIDFAELEKEVMEYQFPDSGAEYIRAQFERYTKALLNPKRKDLLMENEEIISNVSQLDFVAKCKSDNIEQVQVLYRIKSNEIYDDIDKDMMENPKKNIIISLFYHSDLDGVSSAALASRSIKFPAECKNKELHYIPYNYRGDNVNNQCTKMYMDEYANYYKMAIIVDLNLSKQDFNTIIRSHDRIIWIDHHDRSIQVVKEQRFSKRKKFSCLIDTRYSAAHLSYLVFQTLIEKNLNMKIMKTYPTIVSIFDTKAYIRTSLKWVPVYYTKDKLALYNQKQFKYNLEGPTYYVNETLEPQIIYVKSTAEGTDVRFFNAYNYGLACNQYFTDMQCIEPWSPIFNTLLTDNNSIKEMVSTGYKLREIMKLKVKVMYTEETKYTAKLFNLVIKAIASNNSTRFLAEKAHDTFTRIHMRYRDQDHLYISVYTEDPYLKEITLPAILTKYFHMTGGHPGAASVNIDLTAIHQNFQNCLSKNQKLKSLYEQIEWNVESDGSVLRYDDNMFQAFKIISAYLLYEQFSEISKVTNK